MKLFVWSAIAMAGVVMISGGVWWWRMASSDVKVEIIKAGDEGKKTGNIWVDIEGAVVKPGVYRLESGARVKDALAAAGGLAAEADRGWVERSLNLAQNVTDGYKVYIPGTSPALRASPPNLGGERGGTGEVSGCVSINTGSKTELDSLTGIGETRAEAIVSGRPYGRVEELVERKIIPKSVYEKIKTEICL